MTASRRVKDAATRRDGGKTMEDRVSQRRCRVPRKDARARGCSGEDAATTMEEETRRRKQREGRGGGSRDGGNIKGGEIKNVYEGNLTCGTQCHGVKILCRSARSSTCGPGTTCRRAYRYDRGSAPSAMCHLTGGPHYHIELNRCKNHSGRKNERF
jgi:hypothetical protein